ncbi:Uu.00g132830.m01.CDS01 [Anthostomella pinea]|uniref:Uu.00g132830.m01.CDS01 n=1 Tax=Anthostomella pinea TaxID=933095 RepID=A0AAI8YMM9_9PEZI|nr:Uu.00g132830.m01.CDS01 [Anthostomella pinea]
MEKYSQFRDRGSGISPFIPTTTPSSPIATLMHAGIFLFRLPLFVFYFAFYFLVLDWLPLPQVARKLLLWTMLGIPGIWWVDLQLDGVKRGALSQQPDTRFPGDRSVIAAQFTSPVDAIYLAAIFDPIFTVSYPGTQKVQRVSLFRAVVLALSPPVLAPPPASSGLTTVRALVEQNPRRVVAVFPEMTTTNGKGIMPFSPSVLSAPSDAQIFPVSMRYTPPDIATPVPGAYATFLWKLLSKPTHYIRVRIAQGMPNTSAAATNGAADRPPEPDRDTEECGGEDSTTEEQRVIDRIGKALARLGRNKRVGLTLRDKAAFIEAWNKRK